MTPKEKAEKLVGLFKIPLIMSDTEAGEEIICTTISKQCALIAVDEIIASNPCYEDADRGGNFMWNNNTYYWQEVKQEIKKL